MFWISLAVHQEPRNLLKEIRSRANCLITASKLQAEKVLTGFKSPNYSFVGASENFHGPQKTEGNTEVVLKAEKNLKAACNTDLMILEESGAFAVVESVEEFNLDGQSEASLISTLEEETEDLLKQLEEYETTRKFGNLLATSNFFINYNPFAYLFSIFLWSNVQQSPLGVCFN